MRSCFENDGWIDRIAANPIKERKIKMQNEKGNENQHSKIGFAVDAKKKDPTISFDNFSKSTIASGSKVAGKQATHNTTTSSPPTALPCSSSSSGLNHETTVQKHQQSPDTQPMMEKTTEESTISLKPVSGVGHQQTGRHGGSSDQCLGQNATNDLGQRAHELEAADVSRSYSIETRGFAGLSSKPVLPIKEGPSVLVNAGQSFSTPTMTFSKDSCEQKHEADAD